jgi:hypothetical protein
VEPAGGGKIMPDGAVGKIFNIYDCRRGVNKIKL